MTDTSDFPLMGATVHPLVEAAEVDGRFDAFVLTLQPGAASPPHSMTEAKLFVVTVGTVRLHLDGRVVDASAGSAHPVPAGTVHRYQNASNEVAAMTVVVSGDRQLPFLREMSILAARGRPEPADVAELAARFDVTMAPA